MARGGRVAAMLRHRLVVPLAGLAPRISGTRLGRRVVGYLGQYRIRYRFAEDPKPRLARDPAVGVRLAPVHDNHLALRALSWQLHGYGTGEVRRPEVPQWVQGAHSYPADPSGRLRADRVYLVRPDGFVAASCPFARHAVEPGPLRQAVGAHHPVFAGTRHAAS